MIRRQILDFKRIECTNSIIDLIHSAIDNQSNPNDFLLILASGQFNKDIASEKKSFLEGFTTGHLYEQFSNKSDERFYKWFFEKSGYVIDDVLPRFDTKSLDHQVALQIESKIYLAYWESDITLHILYQLARLSNRKPYDWLWRYKFSKFTSRGGFFRKEIKNEIQSAHPDLYAFFDNYVVSQVRNAIAHSQVAPLTNEIKLLNFRKNNKYTPHCLLKYAEWEELICATLAFRSVIVDQMNQHGKMARLQFPDRKFMIQIRTKLKSYSLVVNI